MFVLDLWELGLELFWFWFLVCGGGGRVFIWYIFGCGIGEESFGDIDIGN